MKETKISGVYKPLYTTKKRYILITGGRGSLKSSTVHDFIVRLSFEKGHGVLFLRYTLTSAEKSIIPEFDDVINKLGLSHKFEKSGTKITNLDTGSFILFSGIKTSSGNQTANLKSLHGITTVVIEEGEDFNDPKAFDSIDDSVRKAGIQNRIIFIMNPTSREHFIYKRWIEGKNTTKNIHGYNVTMSNHHSVEHIHSTYHLAEKFGYLNESFLEKANEYKQNAELKETKEKNGKYKTHYYYNYIGGWQERQEGCIFDYTIGAFDEKLPYRCYHTDWGYSPDPLAVGEVAIDKRNKKIYVRDIIYSTSINDVNAAFISSGMKKNVLNVCDTSEERTRATLARNGWNIQKAIKGIIVDDVREIKQYEIILDPNSPNYKIEFDNYKWNDKKASIPVDAYNHLIDGMRYAFRRLTTRNIFEAQHATDNLY